MQADVQADTAGAADRTEVPVERAMWALFEPVHAVTYFSPPARAAFEAVGLRGFWRGYFAGRAAPLGPVGPAPVVATFFGFAPRMVERALPDVWTRAAPDAALAARLDGARETLSDAWPDGSTVAEVADLLEVALEAVSCEGRVLAAANVALAPPTDPVGRVWHACTVLREHRGDGHVAALVAHGIGAAESLAWRAGLDISRETLQPARGWTDEEWDAALGRLVERGWLRPDGTATAEARAAYVAVEAATDRAAAAPWSHLGAERTVRLQELLRPLAVAAGQSLAYPNPIGLAAPA